MTFVNQHRIAHDVLFHGRLLRRTLFRLKIGQLDFRFWQGIATTLRLAKIEGYIFGIWLVFLRNSVSAIRLALLLSRVFIIIIVINGHLDRGQVFILIFLRHFDDACLIGL